MKSPLFKYQIGLAVLGVFTLGLVIFLVVQGMGAREDNKTKAAAESIAEDLNDYVDETGEVPGSLEEADIKDVPPAITYKKLSESKYKFCVTYKTESQGYVSTDLLTEAVTGYQQSMYADLGAYDSEAYAPYYLSIPSAHDAGEQCQTVEPFFYSSGGEPLGEPYLNDEVTLDQSGTTSDGIQLETSGTVDDSDGTICDVPFVDVLYYATIETVNANSVSVDFYGTSQTLDIPPSMNFYDTGCNKLKTADIRSGDYVNVYFDAVGDPVAIVKEY